MPVPGVIYETCTIEGISPVAAYQAVVSGTQYHCLFESVEGGKFRGRHSVIACQADAVLHVWPRRYQAEGVSLAAETPLAAVQAFIDDSQIAGFPAALPAAAAGVFGYLGYDMVRMIEDLPDAPPDPLDLPVAVLFRPALVLVFDHIADTVMLVATTRGGETAARARIAAAKDRLQAIRPVVCPVSPPDPAAPAVPLAAHTPPDAFKASVVQAKAYIHAGDVFQVVLSQRWSRPYAFTALAYYQRLRRLNPSPYLFHVDLAAFQLVGSSPEIMVKVDSDRQVHIRPIAGTRPRGETEAADQALAAELLADPKERAEHLMLLDLGRNDIGRVAVPGTVRVAERFTIERYSHVMHIVSHVTGALRADKTALDALLAGFPAGTTSGAPKVRACQIIDLLEGERRGYYAGAVGYFAANGAMDTCIALRTACIKDGRLYVHAGAGIVADSDPQAEYQETWNKAGALMRAADDSV